MTYKYPKSFWLIAEQIGYARTVVNQKILDDNPRFDRGEKNDVAAIPCIRDMNGSNQSR